MSVFGRVSLYQDNPGEAAFPTVNNDVTQGYTVGSRWYDTRFRIIWTCVDATAGAAKWTPLSGNIIGSLIGADMNATTDQPFVMNVPLAGTLPVQYTINKILATNASLSMTTAVGGVYDTAAKGGTPIVAAAQVYTALVLPTDTLALTIATTVLYSVAPIFSLTTPQGAPATADLYLFADIIPS